MPTWKKKTHCMNIQYWSRCYCRPFHNRHFLVPNHQEKNHSDHNIGKRQVQGSEELDASRGRPQAVETGLCFGNSSRECQKSPLERGRRGGIALLRKMSAQCLRKAETGSSYPPGPEGHHRKIVFRKPKLLAKIDTGGVEAILWPFVLLWHCAKGKRSWTATKRGWTKICRCRVPGGIP